MEIDNILNDMEVIDLRRISFYKLLIEPEKYLKKEKKYILVCERGIRSLKTSKILNNMGYHTYSLKNGFNNLLSK